jgi:EAL domain-containing protein (putative c-di-GMP-specific phosphodiesterase class I)
VVPELGDCHYSRTRSPAGKINRSCAVSWAVETHEDLAFLQVLHCDEAQGFYFSRPVAAPEFSVLLKTGISNLILR